MYRYDEFDHRFVAERVTQFRDQVSRRLTGALSEDEFKPLRLMNGLYLQLHAYMLRVAIPYGTLSGRQMRALGDIADKYDRGYGHFTTRQNIQYNWIKLAETPDILDALAGVEMHAIQTSGNCIRNVTSDPLAGVAPDEIEDPRPVAELIRQWSSLHPEFTFLPRKFKIAVTGASSDRAAIKVHDIGIYTRRNEKGEVGYEIIVGGGQGRTPIVGETIREFLPKKDLLSYLEAILRVYNLEGQRQNKYKARIKILLADTGLDAFRDKVEAEFAAHAEANPSDGLAEDELRRIVDYFSPPSYRPQPDSSAFLAETRRVDAAFRNWHDINVRPHRVAGHAIVTVSLKPIGGAPGDATGEQMRILADLAERYSHDELRVTHQQNIVLPHVAEADLPALYNALLQADLATANIGLVSDIIACPGLDYCALATARSIPIAQKLSERFADIERQREIGPLEIKISGCINACGHHHVGHIGILGLDRRGTENYQITLGGDATETASLGARTGPGFDADGAVDAVGRAIDFYLARRHEGERFIDTYRRIGMAPFKAAIYDEGGLSNAAD